ncbi:MAG TPA: hypothetical protein VJC06_00760 [Candidatus Paceibacterota bacterium]
MVWGKKESGKKEWHLCFLYIPTRLDDGRMAWLEWVERKYSHFAIPGGEIFNYRITTR